METYYKRNKEKVLAYQKAYRKSHPEACKERDTRRRARPGEREKQAVYYREWYRKNGRRRAEGYLEKVLEWQQANPEKVAIHKQTYAALMRREIVRAEFCSNCGNPGDIHAHHYNYEHWKNFIWLCAFCHRKEHI